MTEISANNSLDNLIPPRRPRVPTVFFLTNDDLIQYSTVQPFYLSFQINFKYLLHIHGLFSDALNQVASDYAEL